MRSMISGGLTLLFALLASGPALAYEEPGFEVVAQADGIEYRQYQSYLVAETLVTGDLSRDEAASIGFRRLFDYISGANTTETKISMTAPVQQQPASTKIAMTAPVRQSADTSGWTIAFVLPNKFDAASAPRPTNPEIQIRHQPGELVAALRYSGRWTDRNVNAHKNELLSKLSDAGLHVEAEVVAAFYNAPFSLPFMRRNEVMVAVNQLPE